MARRRDLAAVAVALGVLLAVYLGAIALSGLSASPVPGGVAIVLGNAVTAD